MQQRRVIIIRAHGIHHRLVAELIRLAVCHPALEAAACDPAREALAVVIAARLLGRAVILRHRQTPDLAAPVNDGRVEQTARLQILHQRRRRLIRLATAVGEVALDILVRVPDLAVDKELHETNAALHQPPRNQATRPVFARHRIIQPIEFLRRLALAGNIERLLRRRLHPRRQLVACDARLQIGFARMPREMLLIEPGEEGEVLLLQRALQMRRRFEVQNAGLGGADNRPLEQRRQPAIGPVAHAIDRMPARIGQHHIRGQALAFRAQPVGQPRAQGRTARLRLARVHEPNRRLMAVDVRVH